VEEQVRLLEAPRQVVPKLAVRRLVPVWEVLVLEPVGERNLGRYHQRALQLVVPSPIVLASFGPLGLGQELQNYYYHRKHYWKYPIGSQRLPQRRWNGFLVLVLKEAARLLSHLEHWYLRRIERAEVAMGGCLELGRETHQRLRFQVRAVLHHQLGTTDPPRLERVSRHWRSEVKLLRHRRGVSGRHGLGA